MAWDAVVCKAGIETVVITVIVDVWAVITVVRVCTPGTLELLPAVGWVLVGGTDTTITVPAGRFGNCWAGVG